MDPAGTLRLAVYEHRAFADLDFVKKLGADSRGLPPLDKWGEVVNLFYDRYVAKFL